MPLPTDRQRNDFYLALARLTTSCEEANTEGAIAACEDLTHDARGILAGLYERDPDASSSSEDSHGDADGNAGDEDGDEDGDDDDEDDDDGSGASEDDSQGDDDEEENSSASDAESSGSDDSQGVSAADSSDDESSDDDLVPDYAGIYHPDRHCDRCDVYGHTNQYCPFLPAPKRRRVEACAPG